MDDKSRKLVDDAKFNHIKCNEIIFNIIDTINTSDCNPIERMFIISMLLSLETNLNMTYHLDDYNNDKLHSQGQQRP